MFTKLVIVTVSYQGRSISRMFDLPIVNGHAEIQSSTLDSLAAEIGAGNGGTYTYG